MTGMGVLRRTSVCVLLVLSAVLSGGSGCRNDKDDDGIAGKTGPLDSQSARTTVPPDPSSPGLEPPNHGGDNDMGASSAGSAASPGMPAETPTGAGTAGMSAMGTGGSGTSAPGAAAGSGPSPVVSVDGGVSDGGASDAGASDPCDAPVCGVDQPCEDPTLDCVALKNCIQAVCIRATDACQAECGTDDCLVLESYPEQIACPQ
jgi:hypothetical protein